MVRYGLALVVFIGITLVTERSLRIARRDVAVVVAAAVVVWVNQIGFVYALKTTSASVIALILAATPMFVALIGLAFGTRGAAPPVLGRRSALVRWVSGSSLSAPAASSAATSAGSCSGS